MQRLTGPFADARVRARAPRPTKPQKRRFRGGHTPPRVPPFTTTTTRGGSIRGHALCPGRSD
eukprot:11021903-Lingulodinium_polyedra.AAC.1